MAGLERRPCRIIPDEITRAWAAEKLLPDLGDGRPAAVLDRALLAISARYGHRTADVVAMQLEYPRSGGGR